MPDLERRDINEWAVVMRIFDEDHKISFFVTYWLTTFTMGYELFAYLDFVARGIKNVDLQIILEAWPSILLMIAVFLMLISSNFSIFNLMIAAKIARLASLLGGFYLLIAICMLFLLTSIGFLFTSKGLFLVIPLSILLPLSYWISRRIILTSGNGQVSK
jgi:hypothetical protein